MELILCEDCGVRTSDEHHECVRYDPAHPCPECGAPSVFVFIAAPGTGSGWSCKNGHYDGYVRELTIEEII